MPGTVENQRQQGADGLVRFQGVPQRHVEVEPIRVPAPRALAHDHPRCFEVADDFLDRTFGDADTERYKNVLPLVLADKNVDAVLIILLMQISSLDSNIVDVIADLKRFKKPVFACMTGGEFTSLHRRMMEERGIPTYEAPERAVAGLKALNEYARRNREV